MTNTPAPQILDGAGIRFTPDYVVEIEQDRLIHRIQRAEVVKIVLRWGLLAPRPLVQLVIGIIGVLVGVYFLVDLIQAFISTESRLVGRAFIVMVTMAVLGGWSFFEAWKKGYYLEIHTRKGLEKQRFNRKASRDEIERFLSTVRSKLGWTFDTTPIEEPQSGLVSL